MNVISFDIHRNRYSGTPYATCIFSAIDYNGKECRLLGVFFSEDERDCTGMCAVFDLDKAYYGDIRKVWRGEIFEPELRELENRYLNEMTSEERVRIQTPVPPALIESVGFEDAVTIARLREENENLRRIITRTDTYLLPLISRDFTLTLNQAAVIVSIRKTVQGGS